MPRLVLLGTGMPTPDPARRGPATVVEAGGQLLLVDCGAGAVHRMVEAGLDGGRIRRIAVTHLHSDHISGFADLLWAGAIYRWWRTAPAVVGPPGTRQFLTRLIDAFEYDLGVRSLPRECVLPEVTEVDEGWTEERHPFRLTAFRVEHPPLDQAFGYRIDLEAGSVVVSGDTHRSDNLIRHAKGADILVHEVISRVGMEERIAETADEEMRARRRRMLASHTPADELGDIASRSAVRQLVLSHINAIGRPAEELVTAARDGYDGRVTLGADLMELGVGRA